MGSRSSESVCSPLIDIILVISIPVDGSSWRSVGGGREKKVVQRRRKRSEGGGREGK